MNRSNESRNVRMEISSQLKQMKHGYILKIITKEQYFSEIQNENY